MTALLDRVPVDQISEQARDVKFGLTLLRLAAFLLIMLGRAIGYLWLVPVWCALAIREGWREVHPPKTERAAR